MVYDRGYKMAEIPIMLSCSVDTRIFDDKKYLLPVQQSNDVFYKLIKVYSKLCNRQYVVT